MLREYEVAKLGEESEDRDRERPVGVGNSRSAARGWG